jgi:hypothetical protein
MRGPVGGGALGGGSSFFADNPIMGGWYEPGSYNNLVKPTQQIFPALVEQGGAVVTTPAVIDGNPAWQIRKASGGVLGTLSGQLSRYSPLHMHIVMRVVGAPAAGDVFFCTNSSTGIIGSNGAADTANVKLVGTAAQTVAAGNQAWHLYDIVWWGGAYSFVSIDGAPYQRINVGVVNIGFLIFGAFTGLGSRSDVDIAFVSFSSGRSPYSLLVQRYAYLQAKFPSLALATPAAYPGSSTTDSTPTQLAPAWGASTGWAKAGQSNGLGVGTTASAAFAANIDALGYDYNWQNPAVDPLPTANVRDRVDLGSIAGAFSGNPAFCNAMQARYGGQFTLIDCCSGGSSLTPNVPNDAITCWPPGLYEGNTTPQSLLGSLLSRIQEFKRRGGVHKGLIWHQGEAEAQFGTAAQQAAWPAAVANLVAYVRGVLNDPNMPFIFVQLQPSPIAGPGLTWNQFAQTIQPQVLGLVSRSFMAAAPDGAYIAASAVDHLHLDTSGGAGGLAQLYGVTIPAIIAANNL